MKQVTTIFIIVICCILLGCKEENSLQQSAILGDWSLALAKRDGKPTVMLQNAYLNIREDSLFTNLNERGEDVQSTYEISGNKIVQEGQRTYHVEGLSDSTMLVFTEILGREFEMLFLKYQGE